MFRIYSDRNWDHSEPRKEVKVNPQDEQRLGYDQILETTAWLEERIDAKPEIAMILGSGLGELADEFENPQAFDYADIPHFPTSTVVGHAGRLVFGTFSGRTAVAMQGRFHFYEGWRLDQVTFPVRIFAQLGSDLLVVTNSSGGINADWKPGDLMLIKDHINLTGQNPLIGPNDDRLGPRFPDLSHTYNLELRRFAMKRARALGIKLRTGIYVGVQGPSYETPAEIDMMRRMGGGAVGMSTVPEVIVAGHAGLKVLGISCITNPAAGVSEHALTHEEVTETAKKSRARFTHLIRELIRDVPL